jgi:hypothetical protein
LRRPPRGSRNAAGLRERDVPRRGSAKHLAQEVFPSWAAPAWSELLRERLPQLGIPFRIVRPTANGHHRLRADAERCPVSEEHSRYGPPLAVTLCADGRVLVACSDPDCPRDTFLDALGITDWRSLFRRSVVAGMPELPNDFFETHGLDPYGIRLLGHIARRAETSGQFFASLRRLGAERRLGMGQRKLVALMGDFRRKGWLVEESRQASAPVKNAVALPGRFHIPAPADDGLAHPFHFAVWLAVAEENRRNGLCRFPAQAIGRLIGASAMSARRAMRTLVSTGWLVAHPRPGQPTVLEPRINPARSEAPRSLVHRPPRQPRSQVHILQPDPDPTRNATLIPREAKGTSSRRNFVSRKDTPRKDISNAAASPCVGNDPQIVPDDIKASFQKWAQSVPPETKRPRHLEAIFAAEVDGDDRF